MSFFAVMFFWPWILAEATCDTSQIRGELGGIWEAFGSHLGELEAEEASGRHLEAKSQKSQPLCNEMQKVLYFSQFYKMFLRVGVIKYNNYK